MNDHRLENPVLGYVVIAAALVVGMLSATVFGQSAGPSTSGDKVTQPATIPASETDRSATTTRRWVLGVRSQPTPIGCLVKSVVPGSAAAAVGIRPGDRILTVQGAQVGWFAGQLTPLHRAIDASPTRSVQVLVHRADSGLVRNYRIRLTTLAESLGHSNPESNRSSE